MTNPTDREDAALARRANVIWWRRGVVRGDRARLRAELAGELGAARADGFPVQAVVGDDPAATLRDWADERGVSGRALHLWAVVPVAMLGILVGLSVSLTFVFAAFWDRSPGPDLGHYILAVYAAGGVAAYLCALAAVWLLLSRAGDPHAGRTVKHLAVALLIGAAACVAAGVAYAWSEDFSSTDRVIVTTTALVVIGLVFTVCLARISAVLLADRSHTSAVDAA